MPSDSTGTVAMPAVALRRTAIGLAQGVLLYFLYKVGEVKAWPATNPFLYEALLLSLLFAPLVAVHADSHLPRRSFLVWLATVALLCALLGGYDAYRFPRALNLDAWLPSLVIAPGAALVAGLFIAEALVLAAHADGKRIAGYPAYFDAGWKQAVQIAASVAFVGAFWLLLLLGAGLFKLVRLTFLSELIEKPWFSAPVSTMAFAIALHVTDLRHALVRGIRTLALTLLSWLLPVLTLIVAGFLLSLPFTGLQPLWETRFAAALLIGVAAMLVLLINTAYQDGLPESQAAAALRWAMRVALVLPAPLIGIAAYALSLRVDQYGWTADRVYALACIVVGACYGVGYLVAVLRPAGLRPGFERTNVATSFVVLGVLFSLSTPIADPIRIAVASQMARLEGGEISATAFDYHYLRFDGGRYGADALARMKAGDVQVAGVSERAGQMMAMTAPGLAVRAPNRESIGLTITAGGGRSLPESFLKQDWASFAGGQPEYPDCLRKESEKCEAFLMDFDGDGTEEILLVGALYRRAPTILQFSNDLWVRVGELPARLACEDMLNRLRAGEAKTATARWQDLEIAGIRMDIAEKTASDRADCPKP